jgi:hypothetical protein
MKWKQWDVGYWILEAEDGEVIEQIKKDDLSGLFVLKSSGKQYTSEKTAKAAGEKGKKEQPK